MPAGALTTALAVLCMYIFGMQGGKDREGLGAKLAGGFVVLTFPANLAPIIIYTLRVTESAHSSNIYPLLYAIHWHFFPVVFKDSE